MKALLQTLNKTLICRYGLIIGLVTAVPKKNWSRLVVWDMMCQWGLVHVGFFSKLTIVSIGTLRVKSKN